MPKFKVGDKVRVMRRTYKDDWYESQISIGTIARLSERCLSWDGLITYWRLENYPSSYYNYVLESDIELVDTTDHYFNDYYFNMVDKINNAYQKMDSNYMFITEEMILKDNCEKSPKTIMTTIKEFAKNLVLSTDEKLLRKHGLKNACGDYTIDAKDLVIDKLTSDNVKYLIDIAEQKEKEEEEDKK